jgi:hypothetical protein
MTEGVEIRGGAGEFEAAVIAVVLDKIAREEKQALQGTTDGGPGLSAWARALFPEEPNMPRETPSPTE